MEPAFPPSKIPAVNVAQVPQRSPLRYPGGKTWLVPHIREWLRITKPGILIEPFAGGGVVSLTAVMEDLVERAIMVEIDHDVAAFWHAALRAGPALAERVRRFKPTRERVRAIEKGGARLLAGHGFRTLVLNRTRNSGILAPGASFTKSGENGKGISSRWYPETLAARLASIDNHAGRITFCEGDGEQLLEPLLAGCGEEGAAFIDPPYTAGGKRAGGRLYAHHAVDHSKLFEILARRNANFLMTYDPSEEIAGLIRRHRFHGVAVRMKNAHHEHLEELIITRQEMFT